VTAIVEMTGLRGQQGVATDMITIMGTGTIMITHMITGRGRVNGERGVRMRMRRCRSLKVVERSGKAEDLI
jgi:hypothetical protein